MITNTFIINQINSKYSHKQAVISQNEFLTNESMLSNKEYKDIHFALNRAIFNLEKAKYENSGNLQELEKIVDELKEKKSSFLKNIKTHENVYECENCQDTGRKKDGSYCHCFISSITDFCYDFLGVKKPNFSSFSDNNLDIGSSEINYELYEKYAKNFTTNSKSILLSGNTGTGKTFLSQAIANEVSKKNYNVLYFSVFDFNQALLSYHLSNNFEKSIYFDIFTTCDLLVIDDLGTEPIYKNVTMDYLLSIISQRLQLKKPMIVTTNLTPEYLLTRYGERIYSRLCSKNTIRQLLMGKDLRK